ncbi:MAG: anti-sigma factor family protein [Phycisphaerae bacterium]
MNAERREYLEMQLSAYMDGELTPQEQAEVESWLDADPEARRLFLQLRATIEAVQTLPRARASEELLGNLRTRLERKALLDAAGPEEEIAGAPFLSWGRWVAVAAVIALTVTAGYFTWTLRSERKAVGTQLALREKIPAQEPQATAERIEVGVTTDHVSVPGGTREATVAEVPVRLPAEPPTPAVRGAAPASEAAPVLLAEGRARLELGSEDSARGAPGSEGDKTAAAPQLRGRMTASAVLREHEDALGSKKVETAQDCAAPLEATEGDQGVRQRRARLVSGPQAVEGQARVLTFAFADQNSRAKAIELLRRRVLKDKDEDRAMAGMATRSRRSGNYDVVMQFEATQPADYRFQSSAPSGHVARVGEEAVVTQSCEAGKVDTALMLDRDAYPTEVKLTSIDTNPDSPVNVLKVVAGDKASADQLAAMLGNDEWLTNQYGGSLAKAERVELGRDKSKGTSPTPARRSAMAGNYSRGALENLNGHAVADSLDLRKASPEPSATQPSRETSGLSDAGTIIPFDGKVTWDLAHAFKDGSRPDDMVNEQDAASQVFEVYDSTAVPELGMTPSDEAAAHAATLPASLPPAKPSCDMGGRGMMGGADAGTGVGAGHGGYGAVQGEGSSSRHAGDASAQSSSRPASVVQSQPSGGNLLVVYLEVLSPDTQPAAAPATAAPAFADPTSQPAACP